MSYFDDSDLSKMKLELIKSWVTDLTPLERTDLKDFLKYSHITRNVEVYISKLVIKHEKKTNWK